MECFWLAVMDVLAACDRVLWRCHRALSKGLRWLYLRALDRAAAHAYRDPSP